MPKVLWWGRSDRAYSRNQIILELLTRLGWDVEYFHPLASWLGAVQAMVRRFQKPDLIWVPCFRQRDLKSAAFWAGRWKCPLVFDPLISAYQKEVFEKRKWPPTDSRAKRLLAWEGGIFRTPDVVVADTRVHARYYCETLGGDPKRVAVVHVGADDRVFQAVDVDTERRPVEVLFYGSFLALQGPEVIVKAAALCEDKSIQWVLLGDGDLRPGLEAEARDRGNIRFEPWIPYRDLPRRLARAHILLGIFGTTPKTAMVIPNKVFQSMAMGRPLITCSSEAYFPEVSASGVIGWVPPGDAAALASLVRQWAGATDELTERGRRTRMLYERYYALDKIASELENVLDLAGSPR